jgi:CRP/FNR family transcriptional regulator, anaerobic regulatory protein
MSRWRRPRQHGATFLEPVAMAFDSAPDSSCAVAPSRFNCPACPTAGACLIRDAAGGELAAWSQSVDTQLSLPHAGKLLFEEGALADAIFSVRAGCLKSSTIDADGSEHVRRFYLPGDLIGLDALGTQAHPSRVVAVVPSQVCRIPRERALAMVAHAPGLMTRLLERTSRELAEALALAGDHSADQRVAAFLLMMRTRLGGSNAVRLPMTRRDIGSFLRLATETVCRVLTRFQGKGWVSSEDRVLRLLQPQALALLATPVGLRHTVATLPLAA